MFLAGNIKNTIVNANGKKNFSMASGHQGQRNHTNNSITNTSTQQITDTGNSPAPSQAAAIPAIRATSPEMGVWVAWMMAGKVMTASVT